MEGNPKLNREIVKKHLRQLSAEWVSKGVNLLYNNIGEMYMRRPKAGWKKGKQSMAKKTSIGGQALLEGIMMRGPVKTAMAVRDP